MSAGDDWMLDCRMRMSGDVSERSWCGFGTTRAYVALLDVGSGGLERDY